MRPVRVLPLVLLLIASWATAAEQPMTPGQLARVRQVMSAKISPDGQHIAYLLSAPRRPFAEDNGPARLELHVVDREGNSRPFVAGQGSVVAPAWLPDGSGISFLAKRDGDKQLSLYFIPIGGGEARKLFEHETDIADYDWSPDGKQIAFTAHDKQPADEKESKDKGFDQQVYEEQWEPGRVWIAEPAPRDAWAEPAAKPKRFEVDGHASNIRFSPSGKYLAVGVAPTPSIDDDYMKKNIHVIAADDGKQVGVIENPGKLAEFEWSPDSEQIGLLAGADIHDPNPGRLMVASYTGGKPVDILPDFSGRDITGFAWQDPNSIVFLTDEGTTSGVGRVNLADKKSEIILPLGTHSLAALDASDDGKQLALVADSPEHPQEVFFYTLGGEPKRLTTSNPWLKDVKLAKQEIVKFKARDGLELEGLLIRPLNEEPGKRYPLVVVVHGGPEAHNRHGWLTAYSQPGQILAGEGFAVFYPNYRGSTGRGVEFSEKGQGDYAGKEFDDIIDGVDHLVATGLVDKAKVGVTGGSYGGFASAWMATKHTDRFAASVMFVGISDLVSKFGTTDIPNEMYLVHAKKQPWEDWQFFRDRSPITYAQQARTPLLIMHGKDDPRVHPSQSMELYRYLKTLGNVPVRMVLYPGEGHGNRKAAGRMDYSLRLIQWMKHYLAGPGGNPPPPELDYSSVKPPKPEEASKPSG